MPHLRKSVLKDAMCLGKTAREEDKAEIRAYSGNIPEVSLMNGVEYSEFPISVIDDDGSVLAMFGVVKQKDKPIKVGAVWMIIAPALFKYKRRFIRESREWLDTIQQRYDLLHNVVDERNTVHVRWLKWLGFTFINRHPEYGVEKRPFLEFVRIKKED